MLRVDARSSRLRAPQRRPANRGLDPIHQGRVRRERPHDRAEATRNAAPEFDKDDLEFIQSKEGNLGKGSYGEVQLAMHKGTGIQIAIKKIEKASLSSSKIKETLIREIRI